MGFCGPSPYGWGPASPVSDFDVTPCFAQSVLQVTPSLMLILVGSMRLVYAGRRMRDVTMTRAIRFKLLLFASATMLSTAMLVMCITSSNIDYSAVLSNVLAVGSMILATALFHVEYRAFDAGSMVLTAFWLLRVGVNSVSLRSYLNHGASPASPSLVVFMTLTALAVLMLLVEGCTQSKTLPAAKPDRNGAPFSRALFLWVSRLIRLGARRVLATDDLFECTDKLQSSTLHVEYVRLAGEGKQSFYRDYRVALPFWSIARHFWVQSLLAHLCEVGSVTMVFLGPELLDLLLGFVSSYHTPGMTPQAPTRGYILAVSFLGVTLLQAVFQQHRQHQSVQLVIRSQAMLMNALYHKASRLSLAGSQGVQTGDIVNHMAVDANGLAMAFLCAPDCWSSPLMIIVALVRLWKYLGPASLSGFGVILALAPAFVLSVRLVMRQQSIKLGNMDKRMKLMSEVLGGIKMIKLYASEAYFLKNIIALRDSEQTALRRMYIGFAGIFGLMNTLPYIIGLVSFCVYTATAPPSAPLNSRLVFLSVAYFNILTAPLNMLFQVAGAVSRAMVSYGRLVRFMSRLEVDGASATIDRATGSHPVAISIANGTFTWGCGNSETSPGAAKNQHPSDMNPCETTDPAHRETFALTDITLTVPRCSLTAVIGRVGQGKTALLHAILGEMQRAAGDVRVNGTVAYVSQAAWIINSTVRNNIVMGAPLDECRYQHTLAVCALLPDLKVLEHGDMTLIGDKGVSLSGGQKARISLARAVYAQADVYLLDDCLSAVDAQVDKHIFTHVIGKTGVLAGKTVVLVTHGVHHLPRCDHIMLLRSGRIVESGTYDELMAHRGDTYALINEHGLAADNVTDAESSHPTSGHISAQAASNVGHDQQVVSDVKSARADDDMLTGSIDLAVYKHYLTAMSKGSVAMFGCLLILLVGAQVFQFMWLQHMASVLDGSTSTPVSFYLKIMAVSTVTLFLSACLAIYWWFAKLAIRASKVLHRQLLTRVLKAASYWLDKTPVGRILNRFSGDIDALDEIIPSMLVNSIFQAALMAVWVVLITAALPWMVFLLIIAMAALLRVQQYFLATSREVKRIEAGCKAPIFQHFEEGVAGMVTIRAYGYQARLAVQVENKIDGLINAMFSNYAANRWLGMSVSAIGGFVMFGVALLSIVLRNSAVGSAVGLGVTSAQSLISLMIILTRSMSEVEANMVAVERIRAYSSVPIEAPDHGASVDVHWPSTGAIKFDQYSTAYEPMNSTSCLTAPLSKLSLRSVSFAIRGGERIGICGRTGAGKSTITLSLFRLLEAVSGTIEIDGQDISKVGLVNLRSRLTIIPQDPMLFKGTVRSNLDPHLEHADSTIWKALEQANIKDYVMSQDGELDALVETGGSNYSAGQRQLLTLTRALLGRQRIVIFDEATSATDAETDAVVQRTIRAEFKGCTVLTIAHRITTIMDSDRILVLENGKVVEFDTPTSLLRDPTGAFAKMVENARAE
ncbi:hypothetical protein RI367_007934 [Sorochytrium milnesiophthora]